MQAFKKMMRHAEDTKAPHLDCMKKLKKNFTINDYKQVSVLCSGPEVQELLKYKNGIVIAVLDPELYDNAGRNFGMSFKIKTKAQFEFVGYSSGFGYCKGKDKVNGSIAGVKC